MVIVYLFDFLAETFQSHCSSSECRKDTNRYFLSLNCFLFHILKVLLKYCKIHQFYQFKFW